MDENGTSARRVSAARLRRVRRYEAMLQELQRMLDDPDASAEALLAAEEQAAALERYYGSRAWMHDYADEEAGLFPRELPRGVLSEDGIWNALESWRERIGDLDSDGSIWL